MKNAGKCWFYNIHFPVFFVEIFQMRLLSILSLQIFLRRSQHQFNTVQLVYFTGAWVVIYGNDVGLRIVLSQFLDHTFSYTVDVYKRQPLLTLILFLEQEEDFLISWAVAKR